MATPCLLIAVVLSTGVGGQDTSSQVRQDRQGSGRSIVVQHATICHKIY